MTDDAELLAEVHRLVDIVVTAVIHQHRGIPGVGSPAWWAAPDGVRRAALLILGEAWLLHDPERAVRQRIREMSWDLAASADWAAVARRHVSHGDLERRRARPGPMARPVDFEAAARWAATGRGDRSAAAS